jgi:hypothetical protein
VSAAVGKFKNMTKIEFYFYNRLRELEELAERGDPWVFLCASSFVEYLAKIVNGRTTNQKDYKDFLQNYFFKACPAYATFRFASGQNDLADQMYHVLRCGIVHSFSLLADSQAKKHGGRDRSILIAHRKNGAQHLAKYINNRRKVKVDAVVFTAEDFVQDRKKVTNYIFNQARKKDQAGRQLKKSIVSWVTNYPPIMGKFKIGVTSGTSNQESILTINRVSSA